MFSRVDLPQPLGPTMARNSPRCTVRSTCSQAVTVPARVVKRRATSRYSISGSPITLRNPSLRQFFHRGAHGGGVHHVVVSDRGRGAGRQDRLLQRQLLGEARAADLGVGGEIWRVGGPRSVVGRLVHFLEERARRAAGGGGI